jgi:hypothetical protein
MALPLMKIRVADTAEVDLDQDVPIAHLPALELEGFEGRGRTLNNEGFGGQHERFLCMYL